MKNIKLNIKLNRILYTKTTKVVYIMDIFFDGKNALLFKTDCSYYDILRGYEKKKRKIDINIDVDVKTKFNNESSYVCYEFYYKKHGNDNYFYSLEIMTYNRMKCYTFYFMEKLEDDKVEKLMKLYLSNLKKYETINIAELYNSNLEEGKEILKKYNYVPSGSGQESGSGIIMSDDYFTLYDKDGYEIDVISYVCVWFSPKKDLLLRSYWERFIPEIE